MTRYLYERRFHEEAERGPHSFHSRFSIAAPTICVVCRLKIYPVLYPISRNIFNNNIGLTRIIENGQWDDIVGRLRLSGIIYSYSCRVYFSYCGDEKHKQPMQRAFNYPTKLMVVPRASCAPLPPPPTTPSVKKKLRYFSVLLCTWERAVGPSRPLCPASKSTDVIVLFEDLLQ